jgi:hypothetical protein
MGVLGVYISVGRTSSSVILAPILGILEKQTGSRSEGLIQLFTTTSIIILVVTALLIIYSQTLDSKLKKLDPPEITIIKEIA